MKTRSLIGIGALAVAGIVGVACGGGGEMPDGSGGANTGGTGTGGGTPGTGGGSTTGGASSTGGTGSGGENLGGGAGEGGMGGMGGASTIACDGCAQLFVPLTTENTHTDFEIDLGAGSPADLTGNTVTVRLMVDTAGNAGGVRLYLKNDEDQSYATTYSAWTNLGDADTFMEFTIDVDAVTEPAEFDGTVVRWIGVNVEAGDTFENAAWGDTTVYVDSITFDSNPPDDFLFTSDVEGIAINAYNSPVEGSTVTHIAP